MRLAQISLLLGSLLFSQAATAGDAVRVDKPEPNDGFSVYVPDDAECTRTDREQPTFDGRLKVRRYSWTTTDGLRLGVQWYDLPAGAPAGFQSWTAKLKQARAQGNDVVRVSPTERASFGPNTEPVYYVDMETKLPNGLQIGRAYRWAGRVYLVFGEVGNDSSFESDVVKFVQSFEFVPSKASR